MKTLLISPFFEDSRYPLYLPSENLGIGYLASYLRTHGLAVDILDANMLELSAEEVATQVKEACHDVVGISVSFQASINEVRQVAMHIKDDLPSTHITIGGHFPTFRHRHILEVDENIDSVVRGDGEDTLLELVIALDLKKPLDGIDGLSFRSAAGQVVSNNPRALRQDLDELPCPARDTLQYVKELGHPWPTQVSSSRGCYANCIFCDIRAFYGRNWRARDPIKVVDEIEWLNKEFGSKTFRFTDDEFIGPRARSGLNGPERARRIASEIIKRGLNIELMIDARPEVIEVELFKLLKGAGTIDCLIGIESGVDRILKLYNKGADVSHNLKAIEILRELGISLNLGFIMFDPRMTFAELHQNYQFLVDNDIVTVDSLRSWLWPLFGTPVVGHLRSQGLIIEETLGNLKYRFLDASVERAFQIISECTGITYPLDRALFVARKFNQLSQSGLQVVTQENRSLWTDIFEMALVASETFDLAWVKARVGSLLEYLKLLLNSPVQSVDNGGNYGKIGINLHSASFED
jgi:anaerobic magnesium-protoporphyrin IX monomethyl ester cyclase